MKSKYFNFFTTMKLLLFALIFSLISIYSYHQNVVKKTTTKTTNMLKISLKKEHIEYE